MTSATNSTFATIEGIVTPVNSAPKPNGLLIGNALTTAMNTNDFKTINMTIVRNTATSVDVKINWTQAAGVTPAQAHVTLEVFSPSALGDFTFTPING
jgi:hypothetical protein